MPSREPIRFFAPGTPRTKGSFMAFVPKHEAKKKKPRARMRPTNSEAQEEWVRSVRTAATVAMAGTPRFEGPISLDLVFIFPRPKSHWRTGRNAHILKPKAPDRPAPDLDKLQRAVFDAFKGVLYEDDAQVAFVMAIKLYADASLAGVAGVDVWARALPASSQNLASIAEG